MKLVSRCFSKNIISNNLMVLILMVAVLSLFSCTSEETESQIDPCPGWSCFKVGNEWEYSLSSYVSGTYKLVVTADSVTKIDYTYYLVLNCATYLTDTITYSRDLIRCEGDKVYYRINNQDFMKFDLSLNPGDCMSMEYNPNQDENYPDSVCAYWMESKDVNYIDEFGNNYTVSSFASAVPPWGPTDSPSWQGKINREYGIVEETQASSNNITTTLVSFRSGLEK
jgi:hypothetical protein